MTYTRCSLRNPQKKEVQVDGQAMKSVLLFPCTFSKIVHSLILHDVTEMGGGVMHDRAGRHLSKWGIVVVLSALPLVLLQVFL